MFSPPSNRAPIAPARTPLRKERGVKVVHPFHSVFIVKIRTVVERKYFPSFQLLDISELDMVGAGREAKRRRKTLGNISLPLSVFQLPAGSSKLSHLKYLTSSPLSETETGEKTAKEEAAVVENTTPDYAAGLVSTQVTPAPPPVSPFDTHTFRAN